MNSGGSEATLARAICSGLIPYNGEDIRAYSARTEYLEANAAYIRVSMSACSGQVFAVTLNQKLTLE